MATAVSGSGPAYLFYFIEAMTDAAVKIGLPREMAKEMVIGTVLGAGSSGGKIRQGTGRTAPYGHLARWHNRRSNLHV